MNDHPESLQTWKAEALRALAALRPATKAEVSEHPQILYAQRIRTSASLPPHYLVYFLLAELLEFPELGMDEKVAWTIPIVLEDRLLAIQYRKLGLGVFGLSPKDDQEAAERAVQLIGKATKAARAYFDWKAQSAVGTSNLNVVNRNSSRRDGRRMFDRRIPICPGEMGSRASSAGTPPRTVLVRSLAEMAKGKDTGRMRASP